MEDSTALVLVYGVTYLASLGVAAAFLWVALAKVRPHNPAAGGLMATGVGISLVLRALQPVLNLALTRTGSPDEIARTMGFVNAGSSLLGTVGAAMVVASVAMLVSKPGARG